jgi:hypothetical protein
LPENTSVKRKTGGVSLAGFVFFCFDQSSTGAPTGHTDAQEPQSMQVSGSITYLSSPSEIASTGHSAAQAPQEMHSSVIL